VVRRSTVANSPQPAEYDADYAAGTADQAPGGGKRPRSAPAWRGAGGRWLVWVFRLVVWAVLLLIGYPTKALTNPVFYLKLTLIAVAMVLLVRISRQVFATGSPASSSPLGPLDQPISSRLRNLAIASLICWSGAITAGRLLAYTYHRLTQSH